jgi:ABC-2 type transport system ATP-binding protein
MSAPATVILEGVSKRYAGRPAVELLSLEVQAGEMLGIIGPDGAGKSSVLRIVLGLTAADEGWERTCGLDPLRERRALSRRVGYVSQRFTIYGDLSVDENIEFFASVHGVRDWRRRRHELLEWLRLAPFHGRLADQLSGGMKQKLALACGLIHTPDLLVLDEPTTGVDPVSRRDFWSILTRLQRQGMTILLTTPYLDEAERCQRVALMDRGRLLDLDTPEGLRGRSQGVIVEVLARPRRRALEIVEALPGVSDVETFGERLHAALPGVAPLEGSEAALRIQEALRGRGLEVEAVRAVPPSLEDVFISRLGP